MMLWFIIPGKETSYSDRNCCKQLLCVLGLNYPNAGSCQLSYLSDAVRNVMTYPAVVGALLESKMMETRLFQGEMTMMSSTRKRGQASSQGRTRKTI
mmetsp:Transcript_13841/g.20263  ORF Transcript_13841/g.20263 Transcript_13841/m.20263 type:complete len:97 (+) Transcript_13841:549-839(+)